jgi:Na+:H+ antiporter, NhaA family
MTHSRPPVLAVRLSQPFRRLAEWQAGGGVVLLTAAVIAMVIANSPWHTRVEAFWESRLSVGFGASAFSLSLRDWISDGLMAVFFLLVGLEIKRELLVGELSSRRSAALPLSAALGGMLVPALIFAAFNHGTPGAPGWGIPTATDIAFALGVLALLGPRVPPALTVFLAALAIADDLGAVLVISLFYGHAPDVQYLLAAAGVVVLLVVANLSGAAWKSVYALLGIVLWYCVLRSGVHATVAGVVLALTIPARSRIEATHYLRDARRHLDDFAAATDADSRPVLSNGGQQDALASLEVATEDAQPPLAHFLHLLHVPVNFWIMPLFALANAGVPLSGAGGNVALIGPVSVGVIIGLVLGKPVGILLATWIAAQLGASLPSRATWTQLAGVACLGGIGFTMSLFVAGLAFPGTSMHAQAKFGIVVASILAGAGGAAAVWWATARAGALQDASTNLQTGESA